ncbi:DUF2461 domain-containing protein [Pseudonocardia alni]|uniref:DUF2461 domain-containing protein n=1 Tax=Pseudonocardia alni TaxID=33907 RepID=UPI00280AEDA1|nr:DUF2461 domain-containing protein [Pseudonocardia alni]
MNAFAGFGDGAVEFYDGLLADNSRAYWTDQRETYESDVRGPMTALLTDLEPEFGAGKVFRPYRDVRFAADKTPYKTHCGGFAEPFYVEVSADGMLAAGGYYHMAPDQLTRYRASDPGHPRLDLLRHKGLYVSRSWPPDDVLHGPRARDRVRTVWRASRPVTEWLDDHVGPSELPRR